MAAFEDTGGLAGRITELGRVEHGCSIGGSGLRREIGDVVLHRAAARVEVDPDDRASGRVAVAILVIAPYHTGAVRGDLDLPEPTVLALTPPHNPPIPACAPIEILAATPPAIDISAHPGSKLRQCERSGWRARKGDPTFDGDVPGLLTRSATGAEEARRVVFLLGKERFGSPADARLRAALEAIPDVERLEELIKKVTEVHSWQEMLPAPARRRRGGRGKGKR